MRVLRGCVVCRARFEGTLKAGYNGPSRPGRPSRTPKVASATDRGGCGVSRVTAAVVVVCVCVLDLSGISADLAKINEHSLIDISRVLNDTIREQSASTRSQRSRMSVIKSPKLADLANKIKSATGEARKTYLKQQRKDLRSHRTRVILKENKRRKPLARIDSILFQGERTCNRALWKKTLQ